MVELVNEPPVILVRSAAFADGFAGRGEECLAMRLHHVEVVQAVERTGSLNPAVADAAKDGTESLAHLPAWVKIARGKGLLVVVDGNHALGQADLEGWVVVKRA